MTKRRATRPVQLNDADRLAHVHPRWKQNGPTHVCDVCGEGFYMRTRSALVLTLINSGCHCGGRIVPKAHREEE